MTTQPLAAFEAPSPRNFREQFGNPTGIAGVIAGLVMAASNRRQNAWVVSLLDLRGDENVLEIGFGPGTAIKRIRRLHPGVKVAGVDLSPVMLRQAQARLGCDEVVDLRVGSVHHLPFADATFDRVFSFNSVQFWGDLERGLREIRRVLRPSGFAAIAIQPRALCASAATTRAWGERLSLAIEHARFADVRLAYADFPPTPAVCALARV